MQRVAAKLVPRFLTADHKQQCVVCTELRRLDFDFVTLSRAMTADESRFIGYVAEIK